MTQTFKKLISEAKTPMTREEFIQKCESLFLKHFPNGNFRSQGGALGGDDSIHFSGTLYGGDNVTRMNDPMQIGAWVHSGVVDGVMKDKIQIEWSQHSLSTNPPEGSFYAMGHVKFPMRKKTGTPEQVLKNIETAFKRSAGLVLDNIDNIYQLQKIDKKFLKINK